ncbi:hypothetical protein [Undibacterium danionis]|uniref:Uncharacterized protein n=1 Tax=Undibacterium danionis TaxID=1812100 RepID=A0ABV6IFQ3_9BURK
MQKSPKSAATVSPIQKIPYGVTFIVRLFDEAIISRASLALEKHFVVAGERPPEF